MTIYGLIQFYGHRALTESLCRKIETVLVIHLYIENLSSLNRIVFLYDMYLKHVKMHVSLVMEKLKLVNMHITLNIP